MIDELEVIKACNDALDQIADGDFDSAVMTISTLRADNQKKIDEFASWAEKESKSGQLEIDYPVGITDTDGQMNLFNN
tara:strand:+ start:2242 stop:2475 length:234 start_codon:yes stop_codon:yes gene_type:complete